MQKQFFRVLLSASVLAIGLAFGSGTALYAADEETTPITSTVSATASSTAPGLVIVAVDEQGPAAAAGVVRGDLLLTLNGAPVNSIGEFEALLTQVAAGTPISLQVQHGDTLLDYTVESGDRNGRAYLGLLPYVPARVFTTMAPARRAQWLERANVAPLGGTTATQVVVTGVLTDSVAATAGLQVDDLIIALDGEPLARPRILRTYLAALEPGDDITLTVLRNAEPLEITLTLAEGRNGRADLGVRLGVIITEAALNTITSEATGSIQAMPVQPGFAATAEFGVERFGEGVQRFFRFFQAAPSMQNFTMPVPGMMAVPDVFIYGNPNSTQVMPAMPVPAPGMMVAPEGFMHENSVSIQVAPSAEMAMPSATVEFDAELSQPVPVEEMAIPYY